ncbi:MAG: gliding motility lipoprotein GldD, partial [Bacteroides sp.]
QQTKKNEYFCNVIYPTLNAQLYCTWHRIEPTDFSIVAEESHRLVYQHTEMATAIKEHLYANDSSRVYGILYDIQGNVATPLQLALTDSNSYFFNASLYFNSVPNADSIAPVLEYIRKDVVRLMETYRSR